MERTPSAYLANLAKMNAVWPALEARVRPLHTENGHPVIVTEVNRIKGEHPDEATLDAELKKRGFKLAGIGTWKNAEDLILDDVKPDNFIWDAETKKLTGIDVHIRGNVPDVGFAYAPAINDASIPLEREKIRKAQTAYRALKADPTATPQQCLEAA